MVKNNVFDRLKEGVKTKKSFFIWFFMVIILARLIARSFVISTYFGGIVNPNYVIMHSQSYYIFMFGLLVIEYVVGIILLYKLFILDKRAKLFTHIFFGIMLLPAVINLDYAVGGVLIVLWLLFANHLKKRLK